MQIFLTESFWNDDTHIRVYEDINWDEAILGPSPKIIRFAELIPDDGDERYSTKDIPPLWAD